MVADPVETPLTNPVEPLTVATAVLLEDQVPPEFPLEVKVVVAPTQTFCIPATVPAFGVGVTVTVTTLDVAAAHAPLVTIAL
jgi:hypothetical protein